MIKEIYLWDIQTLLQKIVYSYK